MTTARRIFRYQLVHAGLLAALLAAAVVAARSDGVSLDGRALGVSARAWFAIGLAIPIAHQVFVWACWRLELHLSLLSRVLGRDRGFAWYARGFAMLFASRPVVLVLLAVATRDSAAIPAVARVVGGVVLAAPAVYTIYSVERYFGFERAVGIDHFDPAYRSMPLVREGMFRYVDNAMYACGFLLFWAIAVALASTAALVVAAYSHAYIWVHYLCTERPDMAVIYGAPAAQGDGG